MTYTRCRSVAYRGGMTPIRRVAILSAMLFVATTSACNLGAIFPPPRLVGIDLQGDSTVALGDTIRIIARGTDDLFFSRADPLWDVEWTSTDSRIATLSVPRRDPADTLAAPVLVKGVGRGRVQILVYARGVGAAKIIDVY